MKIYEVLDTVDTIADIWGTDKNEKMEELANNVIKSGPKIHNRMIELLKQDLGIEDKKTSAYAPAAKSVAQPPGTAVKPAVAPTPSPQAKPSV